MNTSFMQSDKLKIMMTTQTHAFMFIHGWSGSKEGSSLYVTTLTSLGYKCHSFDLPGHGESNLDRKTLTKNDFLSSILGEYDSFAKGLGNTMKIIIVGSSFGAYLAILLSEIRPVEKLILRAPANYSDESFDKPQATVSGAKEEQVIWRKQELAYMETRSLRALHNFSGKVLIVESEFDELIPRQTIENYIGAVKDPTMVTHRILPGLSHRLKDIKEKQKFLTIFLERLQIPCDQKD